MIIKQTTKNAVSFREVKSATIAYPADEAFKQAYFYANKGLSKDDMDKPFNLVIVTPEIHGVADDEVICPEQIATTVRSDVIGQPMAVLVTDGELSVGGVSYQFIYVDDRIEILADNGALVGGYGSSYSQSLP